jgi:azurin
MGKQAAMDMMAYGRVGVGNMEAITQMPVEDQSRVLQITIDYAGKLSEAMMGIEENLKLGTMQGFDPKFLADLREHVDNDELAEAKAKMLAMADVTGGEVHTANPTSPAKPGGQIPQQKEFKVAANPAVSRHSNIPIVKENESIRPNETNKKVDPMGID